MTTHLAPAGPTTFGATWSPAARSVAPNDPEPAPRWDPAGGWGDSAHRLWGIDLRSWLVLELAATTGALTVAQLVDRLKVSGVTVGGRASKTISDALRWEVRRGRAIRLGRGHYALGRLARTTRHRMRRRLAARHSRVRHAAPATPSPTIAGSSPEPHQELVRPDPDPFFSAPVVAKRRNANTNPPPAATDLAGRPPP